MKSWIKGAIVKVEFEHTKCLAKLLKKGLIAFYREYTDDPALAAFIAMSQPMFTVYCHKDLLSQLTLLTEVVLEKEELEEPKFFTVDVFTKQVSIVQGHDFIPATLEEVKGLECAAVWDAEHLQERVIAERKGEQSMWVRQMSAALQEVRV